MALTSLIHVFTLCLVHLNINSKLLSIVRYDVSKHYAVSQVIDHCPSSYLFQIVMYTESSVQISVCFLINFLI